MSPLFRRLLASSALVLLAPLALTQGVSRFELQIGEETLAEPFTGSVLVAFSTEGEPRRAMHSWFGAPPLMRFEVSDLAPGVALTVDASEAAAHAPQDWATVASGPWRVQAIARVSRTGRQPGLSPGDLFSTVLEIDYDPASEGSVSLRLDKTVEPTPFAESERIHLFEFESPALSAFHGFAYTLRAGVLLPIDYGKQETYPVLYSVTGFGGTAESIVRWQRMVAGTPLEHCIVVVPDANNYYGHSVFCDSKSIGPWGEALVNELIPALEADLGGAGPEHRYVTGVSSGGWSSLWLQVAYPEAFAGCWSHVPDPIDFHDFQQINLYEPLPDGSPRNMYVDEDGEKRPLARRGGEVMLTYEDFVRREHVLGPGGQIRSFEGTFSPPTEEGTPGRVFDVESGEIDHAAAQAWREYDISHRLLTGWPELRPRLAGKIHVYAGEVDTFYLEGAVERFQALAAEAGLLEDMHVEVVPGMAHALHQDGQRNMEAAIEARWNSRAEKEGAKPRQ